MSRTSTEISLSGFPTTSSATFGSTPSALRPKINLNTWQLVGFSLSFRANSARPTGTMFVGTTSVQTFSTSTEPYPLTTMTLLRIGGDAETNSFTGDVSAVSVMTPGGSFAPTSKPSQALLFNAKNSPLFT